MDADRLNPLENAVPRSLEHGVFVFSEPRAVLDPTCRRR
jgi:hypothetical protein